MTKIETKTFTIVTSPEVMERIERLFALLHFNSNYGHSGIFAIPLDCDGTDKIVIEEMKDKKHLAYEVDAISSVGYDVEVARNANYGGYFIDRSRPSYWFTGPAANLYKENTLVRSIPNHSEEKIHE